MAVRGDDGRLVLSSQRVERFAAETWLRRNGQEGGAAWPDRGALPQTSMRCDPLGCLLRRDDLRLALIRNALAIEEDCRLADIVVAAVPVPRACPAALVIDRFDLWRYGAHAVYVDAHRVRVETVADAVGDRPWALRR